MYICLVLINVLFHTPISIAHSFHINIGHRYMSTIYDIQHNEYRAAIRGTGRGHGECYQIPTQVRAI